jgi:DNA (cytosine-5)-methyltransferase 1
MKNEKTVAEFFAGIGLMRLGLERAGWKTIFANDNDPDKESIYKYHFNEDDDGHFVLDDVHNLVAKSMPSVDLATASFPCTDLSLAGARKGLAGGGSGAFWGFIDCIKNMGSRKPPFILLENVTGFLSSHNGADFESACIALNELGYSVDPFIVDASNFVPQSRQRLFVVGTKDLPDLNVEEQNPAFFQSACRPAALADFIFWHPEINWNIRPLPELPISSKRLPEVIEELSPNSKYWWSKDRANYLLDQMSPKHRRIANIMIDGEELSYGTVFRRVRNGKSMAELRTDGIAGCLRTPRGGSGRQILFVAGNGEFQVRLLTPRECARLMGADHYRLDSNLPLNKALFGFGDAVCVSVVEWIATHYLNPLWDDLSLISKVSQRKVRYGTRS